MLVVTRFDVPPAESEGFRARARAAVEVLGTRAGFRDSFLGRNIDDPRLWTLTLGWADVGSYRRALSGYESKMVVVPLLSLAIDEPTAYEDDDGASDIDVIGRDGIR